MRFNVGRLKLEDLKKEALAEIANAVSAARSKYISALPGQEMIYLAKKTDAEKYFNTELPNDEDFQWVLAEAKATDVSMRDAAMLILKKWNEWQTVNANIDRIKRSATIAINDAETIVEVYDLKTVAISSLLAV